MGFDIQIGRLRISAGVAPAYEGASTARRNKGVSVPSTSGTQAVIANGQEARDRARHLARNNPWASNAVEAWASNMVGKGIDPRSTIENRDLRERIHDLWSEWTEVADADGVLSFAGLQNCVARNVVGSGEVFSRLRPRRDRRLPVPLQIQLLEADQVPFHVTQQIGSNRVVAGIETNAIGRRVRYHMYRAHPSDPLGMRDGRIVQVPASQVLHVYLPDRPGQMRGATWFASVLQKLLDVDVYDDAEVMRKKTAALWSIFIARAADEGAAPALSGEQEMIATTGDTGEAEAGIEPGTVNVLEDGEEPHFGQPADVGGNYEAFMRSQLQSIAVGVRGLTYELLTGDHSRSNFSAGRMGLIEFRRRALGFQDQLINHQFNRRVWRAFLEQAVLSGRLQLKNSDDFEQIVRSVKWVGHGFEHVQPREDSEAMVRRIRAGTSSRSEEASQMGRDPESLEREIAADNKRADELDLVFDSDPRRVARSGTYQETGTTEQEQGNG